MTAAEPPAPPSSSDSRPPGRLRVPRAPALAPGLSGAGWLETDGEVRQLSHDDALAKARASAPLVCHAPATARRSWRSTV